MASQYFIIIYTYTLVVIRPFCTTTLYSCDDAFFYLVTVKLPATDFIQRRTVTIPTFVTKRLCENCCVPALKGGCLLNNRHMGLVNVTS